MSCAARGRRQPPIDHAVLAALRQDVGEQVLQAFIRTYVDLLISRLGRIDQAIADGDGAAARLDVPDLRTSSAMLGAGRLAELADALEQLLGRGRIAAAGALLPTIRGEAAAVVLALRAAGENGSGPHPPNR
jgi:HPt (histidine-containing phosphotransfer) domain-containing protein